jgi:hypothetical protein
MSIFVAGGTSLPSQCLATEVSSNATVQALTCQVIFNSKVMVSDVLYPVQIISKTQYAVKGSRQLALPINSNFSK